MSYQPKIGIPLWIAMILFCAVSSVFAQNSIVRIEALELDKSTVEVPCPPGLSAGTDRCKDEPIIKVRATISGDDLKNVGFYQTVSGGRIIQGEYGEFTWDFTGVPAGTYTLSVTAVDRDEKSSESKSVTASVVDCHCEWPERGCASISIEGPESVAAGDEIKLMAVIKGGDGLRLNWSVMGGVIVGDHGAHEITIRTRIDGAETITATLSIDDDGGPPYCTTSTSFTVKLQRPELVRHFEVGPTGELKMMLDVYISEIHKDLTASALIYIYPGKAVDFDRVSELITPASSSTAIRSVAALDLKRWAGAGAVFSGKTLVGSTGSL
jgi:hypothetical protein